MKRLSRWWWIGVVGLLMGCGGPLEEPAPQAPIETPQERVEQTIVRELPDGSLVTETLSITVEEQQTQLALRDEYVRKLRSGVSQQDLLIDSGCAGSSLWLFAGSNQTGRQLCLYKQAGTSRDWLDLGRVLYYYSPPLFLTWAGRVRSLYSGVHPGSLQSCTPTLCYTHFYLNFAAYQRIDSVPATDPFGGNLVLNQAYLYTP